MRLLNEMKGYLNNVSVCLQRSQALPGYLSIVRSAPGTLGTPGTPYCA